MQLHRGEAGEIGKQILWGSGNEEQNKHQQVQPPAALDEFQRIDLFPGNEGFHHLDAQKLDKKENDRRTDRRADQAQQKPLPGAEGVARADFQGLAGDHRHHNLEDHHPHHGKLSAEAVAVHPQAEGLRVFCQVNHRLAHVNRYHGEKADQNQKRYDADYSSPDQILSLVLRIAAAFLKPSAGFFFFFR